MNQKEMIEERERELNRTHTFYCEDKNCKRYGKKLNSRFECE